VTFNVVRRGYQTNALERHAEGGHIPAISSLFSALRSVAGEEPETYIQRIKQLTESIRVMPNNLEAYRSRAIYYTLLGKYQNAVADRTAAIHLSRNDPLENCQDYSDRARLYLWHMNHLEEAASDLTELIRLYSQFAPSDRMFMLGYAFEMRAKVYEKQGHHEKAIADLRAELQFHPGRKKTLERIEKLEKGLKHAPTNQ
jgi:tetratricopeptide (TPR) repeat protein